MHAVLPFLASLLVGTLTIVAVGARYVAVAELRPVEPIAPPSDKHTLPIDPDTPPVPEKNEQKPGTPAVPMGTDDSKGGTTGGGIAAVPKKKDEQAPKPPPVVSQTTVVEKPPRSKRLPESTPFDEDGVLILFAAMSLTPDERNAFDTAFTTLQEKYGKRLIGGSVFAVSPTAISPWHAGPVHLYRQDRGIGPEGFEDAFRHAHLSRKAVAQERKGAFRTLLIWHCSYTIVTPPNGVQFADTTLIWTGAKREEVEKLDRVYAMFQQQVYAPEIAGANEVIAFVTKRLDASPR